jgi:tRNA-uridine 2-sulfurtransferase
MKKKCLVLYSGGLDSRVTLKLMQKEYGEKNVEALHFLLPFGCNCADFSFVREQGAKLKIFNCFRGKLFKEYMELLKSPKYGRGKGVNPCRDCKIFIFNKAKEYARERGIEIIATGEVPGQRPMSQTTNSSKIIDENLDFKLRRPLEELGIRGRRRIKQMELAKKFGISYPDASGGCLLCEKFLKKRFKFLIEENLINEKTLCLAKIGRHFSVEGFWFVVARDEPEGKIISLFENSLPGKKGVPAVYYNKKTKKAREIALELQDAYKKRNFNKYEEYKL